MYLRQKQNLPWKEIFLKFFARLSDFDCADCSERFIFADLNHCSFHPMTPKFTYGLNQGYYPCCNSQALRFNTSLKKNGCTSKNHSLQVPTNLDKSTIFSILSQHTNEVCEPYEFEKENPATG
jgi:CHORD